MAYGSLFTGGGLACWGARAAGLELAWGVELEGKIAEVANANLGGHVLTADVLNVDPRRLEPVDIFHCSPPCPNFSVAKTNGAETALDIALAQKVAEFISVLQPRVFTLENVPAYRHSKSWALIEQALYAHGYWLHVAVLNAADFGVPTTRRRLIVRAVRGGYVPQLPPKLPWVGWYEAIEDLIPDLPESQFASWQLARLPKALSTMLVSSNTTAGEGTTYFGPHEPAMTVTTGTGSRAKALLIGQGGYEGRITTADGCEPAFTVTANTNQRNVRAFLHMTGASSSYPETRGTGVLEPEQPANTVTPSSGRAKAFLVDGANASSRSGVPTNRAASKPSFTITAGEKGRVVHRGLLETGRVVRMTPRALARFQGISDDYRLPDDRTLACRIIGNACCPPVFEAIYRGLVS